LYGTISFPVGNRYRQRVGFLNRHVGRWCAQRGIHFTRGRPYKKDDNAHIEQKNWTHVRKLMGWEGYDTAPAVKAMNDLYRHELRLWMNVFQPSVKLVRKVRVGARLRRVYGAARTPLQRVQACGEGEAEALARLQTQQASLDPFELHRPMKERLGAIYELAHRRLSPSRVRFPASARPADAKGQRVPTGGGLGPQNASRMPPDQRSDTGTTVSTTRKPTKLFLDTGTTSNLTQSAHVASGYILDGLTAQPKVTF
jgi:hypothetical protein